MPTRHARIEKYSAPSAQLISHPHDSNIDLKTGWVAGRVHDVRDCLEHGLDDGVELPTPNRFLPEVRVLLQHMVRFLQLLKISGHLDKGTRTSFENERRVAHDDSALLSASVTTGLDPCETFIVDGTRVIQCPVPLLSLSKAYTEGSLYGHAFVELLDGGVPVPVGSIAELLAENSRPEMVMAPLEPHPPR